MSEPASRYAKQRAGGQRRNCGGAAAAQMDGTVPRAPVEDRKGKRKVRFSDEAGGATGGDDGAPCDDDARVKRARRYNAGLLAGSDDDEESVHGGAHERVHVRGAEGAGEEEGPIKSLDPVLAAARRSSARAAARDGVGAETLAAAARIACSSGSGGGSDSDAEGAEEGGGASDDEDEFGRYRGVGGVGGDGDVPLEPFNLKRERQLGTFDEDGNYTERRIDRDVEDAWLDSVEMDATLKERMAAKAALAAKTEAGRGAGTSEGGGGSDEGEGRERTEAEVIALKRALVEHMHPGESVTSALARLSGQRSGKGARGGASKSRSALEPAAAAAVAAITEAASALMDGGDFEIYQARSEELRQHVEEHERKGAARNALLNDANSDAEDMFADSDDDANKAKCAKEVAKDESAGQPSHAMAGYTYDPSSGYYVDASTGTYYDTRSKLFYSSGNGKWYSHDAQRGYVEAEAPLHALQQSAPVAPAAAAMPAPTAAELESMGVRELKQRLLAGGVDPSGYVEKSELLAVAKKLCGV